MSENEITAASRDDLIAYIRQLEAIVAQKDTLVGGLQARITALEQKLAGRSGPGMPGTKVGRPKSASPETPRKKRGTGFGRPRLPPTETVQHALEQCPACRTHLVGGWVQATREVIELPRAPVRVIEHQYVARVCPVCQKRRVPPVELTGVVLEAQQRLGIGVVSLITTLREEGRLPFATIQWYLATVHQLHLSVGELVRVVAQVAARAKGAVEQIKEAIQASPVVHADETGWREKGTNGYVWTFRTPTHGYFVRGGRNKEMVDDALGTVFAGVLVCDFYASYDHYPGLKQRCWAHLLRDIHELQEVYPREQELAGWAAAIYALYDEAKAFGHPQEAVRLTKQRECEERLLALCRPFLTDPLAVHGKLCRRVAKYLSELFVFVANPLVPPTNNAAERSLRHVVTSRKISGGTQSATGTQTKMTLASLFATSRLQELNPLLACQQFLHSPLP
jgi:transposase